MNGFIDGWMWQNREWTEGGMVGRIIGWLNASVMGIDKMSYEYDLLNCEL